MPRSAKAPPPPPEPDINELIQNDVAHIKRLLGLDVNRLAIGSEIDQIDPNGLFGSTDFTITGVNIIEFVNVSSTIVTGIQTGGAAIDTTPPLQVTGLNATAASNTVVSLTWTANADLDINHYNVYRGTTPGFAVTLGVTTPIATPSANSYSDTGRTASTTYYYKVAAVDNAGNIGPLSIEDSVTTLSAPPSPPAQTVGLTITPQAGSDTQLNLAWTASTAPAFSYYNVYNGPSGFTPAPAYKIAQVSTNSYPDTGLSSGNTYYYKVSAVDTWSQEGTASTQASGTTTTTAPGTAPTPSLELHLDSTLTDTSPNSHTISGTNTNGFLLPGAFGTAGWRCNYPVLPAIQSDNISPAAATNPPTLQMDTAVGFSLSFWINPQDISALSFRRVIMEKADDASNKWSIQIDSSGIVYFFVKKAGVEYKRQKTGFTTGAWQHVAAVFNGATNTVELYRDGVAGVSSVATGQYGYATDEGGTSNFVIGFRRSGVPFPDGRNLDTHYVGAYDEIRYYRSAVLTLIQITSLRDSNTAGAAGPPDTTAPAQVVGLVATGSGDTTMSLSWTANTEPDLNHYNVYRGTSSGFSVTPGVTTPTGTSIGTAHTFSDSGLTASTTYYYKVLATDNASNLGSLSTQASGTTTTPDVTAPAQTVGLAVTVISSTQLNLTWTASIASDLNHYNVYRGTSSGFSITPGTTTPTGTPTTNSFSDVSLSPSTTYYYKVLAADNSGNLGTLSTQAQGTTQATVVTAPAQVTGLVGRPFGQGFSTVFLIWNANTEPDLNQYNIYRGTTAGFTVTPGVTVPFATTTAGTTQKQGDGTGGVGYSPSTTYYFKVAAVDTGGDIGPTSAEISVSVPSNTTITPTFYLPYNGDQSDFGPNSLATMGYRNSGFTQPGKFGTSAFTFNWPVITTPADLVQIEKFANPPILQMDPSVGFSVSFWIYPLNLSALTYRRVLAEKPDSLNQKWTLQIDSSGILYFFVKKAGVIYKRQISGFTTGSWQHVAATFNGSTNALQVYRNGVAGVSSTATPQWPGSSVGTPLDLIFNIGKRANVLGSDPSDGGDTNTAYQGHMDEFLWYRSYILSQTEITNLVNTNVTNTSGISIVPPAPTPNLWLKLDGNYNDSSTFGNSVIPSNASGFTGSGKFGSNSVKLNTPTVGPDYISVTDNSNVQLDMVNGFSYSFWMYPTSSVANQYIISKRIDSNNYFTCYFNGTDIIADIVEGSQFDIDVKVANASPVSLNTWHHVVLVYSGNLEIRGFVDLALPLYPPISPSLNSVPTGPTNLIIGNLSGDTSGTKAFRGRIDEFQYFKGVRFIQQDVIDLYNTNAP